MFIVISAASGTGKTTLIKKLLSHNPQLKLSVSHTTRPQRQGEKEGVDYYFIKESDFRAKIRRKGFVEWEEVHGHLYGTSIEELEHLEKEGSEVIFDIDVKGALNFKSKFPKSLLIFLAPPSWEVLEGRLRSRGTEDLKTIEKRLDTARQELKKQDHFDYTVVNEDLEKAYADISRIIQVKRH